MTVDERETTPYSTLTPHRILDLLVAVGLEPSGELLQLNSYENRVLQARLDDGRFVVAKFYRPGRWSDAQILEEHAFAKALIDDEVPVAAPMVLTAASPAVTLLGSPPTLAVDDEVRMAVSPRQGGRHLEFDAPGVRQRVGYFLGRLHAVGQREPFHVRRTLNNTQWGQTSRDWVATQAVDLCGTALPGWLATADRALALCDELFAAVGPVPCLRLHGDVHPGNLLWTDQGPHFVDLDDACNGPAIQDFWMLLDSDQQTMRRQLLDLLEGYESFREFNWREVHLIEALRTLRIINHSAWIGQRWADPAFPAAFPWFGESMYWTGQAALLHDQCEMLQEALTQV